jgi:hypothetical protein
LDPLSTILVKTVQAEMDPLSRALAAAITTTKDAAISESSTASADTFEPWSSKKSGILSRYITTEKISMTTAMSNDDSMANSDKGKKKINNQNVMIHPSLSFSGIRNDNNS